MRLRFERAPYEKLIQQIVYMEEYINDIASRAAEAKLFRTEKRAQWFFEEYIGEVESLFRQAEIIDDARTESKNGLNSLPFIVLDSSFILVDSKNRLCFCHMAYDVMAERKRSVNNIYFLSGAGRALLLKKEGESVKTNLGNGPKEYTVNSINMN